MARPPRALGAELRDGPPLVLGDVLGREGLRPAAVCPAVYKDLGAGIPEGAAQGDALGGVALHPVKGVVLDGILPPGLVHGDVEKVGDAVHLPRHVALEVREVDEQDVGEVAESPPGADVLPEGPERVSVAVHPVAEVLPDVGGGRLDGRPDATRGVVECVVPELVGVVICWRHEGLPLAIEIAAARVRFLGPTALLARLDRAPEASGARDLPERQRTMRATLDWSRDLLSEPEKALFARLSVFAGGFDLEAAEAVDEDGGGEDVLVLLEGLVEQSLVRAEPTAPASAAGCSSR